MVRGTFANVRLRNELAPGTEGSWTTCFLDDQVMSIFAASCAYAEAEVPLVVLAGKEYGTGSSRDWAAKGPYLLGVKAVLAEMGADLAPRPPYGGSDGDDAEDNNSNDNNINYNKNNNDDDYYYDDNERYCILHEIPDVYKTQTSSLDVIY